MAVGRALLLGALVGAALLCSQQQGLLGPLSSSRSSSWWAQQASGASQQRTALEDARIDARSSGTRRFATQQLSAAAAGAAAAAAGEQQPHRSLGAAIVNPKMQRPLADWPTAQAVVNADPSYLKVPENFLATSHEWDRIFDYGAELITSWANVFKMLSNQPLLRVGGASQDLMPEVPPASTWQAMRRFADASGCRYLIGLPLHQKNAPAMSKRMIADAQRYLGDKVVGYELGNEPEFWPTGLGGWTANGTWAPGFAPYLEWFHKVATEINPCGPAHPPLLSGPGWGNVNTQDPAWMAKLIERGQDLEKPGHCYLREANIHYYPYINNVTVNAQELLAQELQDIGINKFGEYYRIANAYSLPLRISETNSLYGGGRPGFSETMVGTLWITDALFAFANAGAVGFHLHWGKGGAPNGKEGNPNTGVQTNFHFDEGPDRPISYPSIHAPWYAYLFWTLASAGGYGQAADTVFTQAYMDKMNGCSSNIKVWALKASNNDLRVALIHKGEKSGCNVQVSVAERYCRAPAAVQRMMPGREGIHSKAWLTMAGQTYEGAKYSGRIQGRRVVDTTSASGVKDGRCSFKIALPASSAALLELKQG